MVQLKENKYFNRNHFQWHDFRVVENQRTTRLTGSDDPMPILMVRFDEAYNVYGANIHTAGGPCPVCKVTMNQELMFNPQGRYSFLQCPACLSIRRWLNHLERLDDLKVVRSGKRTQLDEDSYL